MIRACLAPSIDILLCISCGFERSVLIPGAFWCLDRSQPENDRSRGLKGQRSLAKNSVGAYLDEILAN